MARERPSWEDVYAIGIVPAASAIFMAGRFNEPGASVVLSTNGGSSAVVEVPGVYWGYSLTLHESPPGVLSEGDDLVVYAGLYGRGLLRSVRPTLGLDDVPPAAVSDLSAATSFGSSVRLEWTAPGDDGTEFVASAYDIHYSTTAPENDLDAWWAAAAAVDDPPVPEPAGATQTFIVPGLDSETPYWIALVARDEVGNRSDISNVASVTTGAGPAIRIEHAMDEWVGNGDAQPNAGELLGFWLTLHNDMLEDLHDVRFFVDTETLDEHLAPYGNNHEWLPDGLGNSADIGAVEAGSSEGYYLDMWVSSYTPDGHQANLTLVFYAEGGLLGTYEIPLTITGTDETPPIGWINLYGDRLEAGVEDGGELGDVGVQIRQLDGALIADLDMFDDATNGDPVASDRWYSALVPTEKRFIRVTVTAEDAFGNVGSWSRTFSELYGGSGFRYDVQDGGWLEDGSDDAYDSMYWMSINGSGFYGPMKDVEDDDREVVLETVFLNGLNVSRKVYVPADHDFARYLEILENPTSAPITVDLRVYGNLGSNGSTQVISTSSGDTVLSAGDLFAITDDSQDGFGDPSLAHVFDGTDGDDAIDLVTLEVDNLSYTWEDVVVPAYGTVVYAHFAVQAENRNAAYLLASELVDFPPIAATGMSTVELGALQNFTGSPSDGAARATVTVATSAPGETEDLAFGFAAGATDGLDAGLGETERPPLPPAGVFDARFLVDGINGLTLDLRDPAATGPVWEVRFQPGTSGYPITLSWDPASLPEGAWRMTDPFGGAVGIDVSMYSQGSLAIMDPGITGVLISTGAAECTYNLPQGWSMISLCGDPTSGDATLATNYPDAISLFAFAGGYQQAQSLGVGVGYWINMASAQTYTMRVTPASTVTLDLPTGWSMIGGPDGSVDVEALQSGNSEVISVFGFSGGYQQATSIESGQGYWINMANTGQVVLSSGAAARPVPVSAADFSGPTLWVQSGAHRQEIQLGVEPDMVTELPPAPPAGVFDTRVQVGEISSWSVPRSDQPTEYLLRVQGQEVQLGWDVPSDERGRWELVIGGRVVRLSGRGTVPLGQLDSAPRLWLRHLAGLPPATRLEDNFPNPFNPVTTIRYALKERELVSLRVYEITGQVVREMVSMEQPAGPHEVVWDGRDAAARPVSSGVYLYELRAGSYRQVKKMLLMK